MKKGLLNALLGVASLGMALAVIEGLFSLADYDYRPLTISARDDLRDTLPFNEHHFEFDSKLIWRPRSSYEIFNAQGYRGPELAEFKAAGETRIFTLGDSNTLGWRGQEGANWPAAVADLAGPRVRVVNAGVWGYSSLQGLVRLEEALGYAPDIVTISFGSNDGHPVRVPDADRVGRGPAGPWIKERVGRLRLGRLLMGALARLTSLTTSRDAVPRVDLEAYRSNLRAMVARARAAGAQPVLLTRPYIGVSATADSWKVLGPDYNAATFEVARELEVPLIDLYTLFKHREEFFADDSHFSEAGHALAARWAWQELRPLVADLDP